MKVCLISSSGGHFTELKQVMSFLPQIIGTKDYDYFFVTMNRVDTKNLKNTFYMTDTSRNPFTILINLFQSLRLFSKTRPDVIVTTGAGFSVPFAYVAKLFGKKIVCIESFCRTSSKSLFARLLYPISNKFYVQWNDSLKLWGNKTEYLNIIELNTKVTLNDFKNAKDVFVTVGSSIYQFDRLIKFVDDLAKESPDKRFFCQSGLQDINQNIVSGQNISRIMILKKRLQAVILFYPMREVVALFHLFL